MAGVVSTAAAYPLPLSGILTPPKRSSTGRPDIESFPGRASPSGAAAILITASRIPQLSLRMARTYDSDPDWLAKACLNMVAHVARLDLCHPPTTFRAASY